MENKDTSTTVEMFKMPFETKHFNKNQRVFIQYGTGAMAAKVVGKFRGKHRYVSAWVRWEKAEKEKELMPEFKQIDVSSDFAKRHKILSLEKI